MFRSKTTVEREENILRRRFLSKDQSSCNEQQFSKAVQYEMCLFRSNYSFECRKQAAKLAEKNKECKAIKAEIEDLDRKIFPRPGTSSGE